MLTIARTVKTELEVKRSRFITLLSPAVDEADARTHIDQVRAAYPDARHHCTAFRVHSEFGPEATPIERSNDDGEPSGTAGTPMLEALRGARLERVVAVVTRYFGGTLLGTGGLVRAYTDAVNQAISEAQLQRFALVPIWQIDVPLTDVGRIENHLRGMGLTLLPTTYSSSATLTALAADGELLATELSSLTSGSVTPRQTGSDWVAV